LPKASSRGLMLIHDINVREQDFGVWRCWEELSAKYPSFAFLHCHGLGVAWVGTEVMPGPITWLMGLAKEQGNSFNLEIVRSYFHRLDSGLVDRLDSRKQDRTLAERDARTARLERRKYWVLGAIVHAPRELFRLLRSKRPAPRV